jgi:RNA polymerase sigma-70 factor (ECF subfamily)
MTNDREETRWVLRAQAGDREALERLLRAVEEPLYRYLLGVVGRPDLAEDVLQEVFLLLYRKLRWLRDPALFRPWAYRIASREAFRAVRRQRRWPEAADPALLEEMPAPADPSLEAAAVARDWERRLPQLLDTVSPASRAVLVLHYLQEMTLEDVAAVLAVPIGTVKSRLAYGLQKLRALQRQEADR